MTSRGLAITFALLTALWMQFACPCRAFGLTQLFDPSIKFAAPCHDLGDCTCHTHGGDSPDSDNDHSPPTPAAPDNCSCGGTPTQLPPPPAHSPVTAGAPLIAILDHDAAPKLSAFVPTSHRDSPSGEPRRRDAATLLRQHCALIS